MLDIIIKDGLIVDGTRSAAYKGDIGIKDGIIKEIQSELCCAAKEVIDADGLVVAPGFIDIHSHSDLCSFVPGLNPQSKLYQGITLEIIGNCGMSCIPVNDATRLIYQSRWNCRCMALFSRMILLLITLSMLKSYQQHLT